MKPFLLLLALLMLTGCTLSARQTWLQNCRVCVPIYHGPFAPLTVEGIEPSADHAAQVRANHQVPRRPYRWDYSLDFW